MWVERINENAEAKGYKHKLYALQNQTLTIGDVNFIGATLWTDYNKEDQFVMSLGPRTMNDYHYIGVGDRRIKPADLLTEHKISKKYIQNQLKKLDGPPV